MKRLLLATRKSPLALAQAHLVAAHLRGAHFAEAVLQPMVSTGDRQTEWSLETRGGKGLFTAELETSLLCGKSDLAVHSGKDLPGEMPAGLAIAGYLPRADTRDVLVLADRCEHPRSIATGSPRRRAQLKPVFPAASFAEIRGNVDTRLNKIAAGVADATMLAAAGLARLHIAAWPGVTFRFFSTAEIVPAVAQGAIAIQCRTEDVAGLQRLFDGPTARAVSLERALQSALGGGCQTALGAHVHGLALDFYHEQIGYRFVALTETDFLAPDETARRLLNEWRMR